MPKRRMGDVTEFEGEWEKSTEGEKGAEWYILEVTEIYTLDRNKASFYTSNSLIVVRLCPCFSLCIGLAHHCLIVFLTFVSSEDLAVGDVSCL